MATKKVMKSESSMMSGKSCEMCGCSCGGRWAQVGWGLLLVGGLAHMLPTQMAPLLQWGMYGVSVQMAVGVVSVVMALYYLLGKE